MVLLREYDIVRVVKLIDKNRHYDGAPAVARPPAIGDVATIVHEYRPGDPSALVTVEMVDADECTVWLADFDRAELGLVEQT